jgi:hypothetical protein
MITQRKIDFFGGLHGNFLELAVNHAIDQNTYNISQSQFNKNGACHNKNHDSEYIPITVARHYSFNETAHFTDNDWVIRIVPTQSDMLIAVVNSFSRAGNQSLDINCLEQNTYNKLKELPKLNMFLKNLVDNHGIADNYKRNVLRHYFKSMFSVPEHGLNMFINWAPAQHVHEFKFANFFYLDQFFESLQGIARFTNLEFRPSMELVKLHAEFLEKNQGWHCHLRCSKIVESIIKKEIVPLELNIIEEAWILYKISQIFNLYDLDCCNQEYFPPSTEKIINEIDKGFLC